MPDFLDEVAVGVVVTAAGLSLLYWVIRLAVRHGMRDRDRDRVG